MISSSGFNQYTKRNNMSKFLRRQVSWGAASYCCEGNNSFRSASDAIDSCSNDITADSTRRLNMEDTICDDTHSSVDGAVKRREYFRRQVSSLSSITFEGSTEISLEEDLLDEVSLIDICSEGCSTQRNIIFKNETVHEIWRMLNELHIQTDDVSTNKSSPYTIINLVNTLKSVENICPQYGLIHEAFLSWSFFDERGQSALPMSSLVAFAYEVLQSPKMFRTSNENKERITLRASEVSDAVQPLIAFASKPELSNLSIDFNTFATWLENTISEINDKRCCKLNEFIQIESRIGDESSNLSNKKIRARSSVIPQVNLDDTGNCGNYNSDASMGGKSSFSGGESISSGNNSPSCESSLKSHRRSPTCDISINSSSTYTSNSSLSNPPVVFGNLNPLPILKQGIYRNPLEVSTTSDQFAIEEAISSSREGSEHSSSDFNQNTKENNLNENK